MAEIKIEKKSPVWPWILLVLIILAAVYFFWYKNDQKHTDNAVMDNDSITKIDDTSIYRDTSEDSTVLYNGNYGKVYKEQAVADYLSFIDNKEKMADKKDYYKTAFTKLIAATKIEADKNNVDINTNISAADTNVDSNKLKIAATDVSKSLENIQQKMFSTLSNEAEAVKNAASKVDDMVKPDVQNDALDSFLDKSATLLQKMTNQENSNQ